MDISLSVVQSELVSSLDELEQGYAAIYGLGEESSVASEIIGCYRNDPMFDMHYQRNPDDAVNMVITVVNDFFIEALSSPQPQWIDGAVYRADGVPDHQQIQNNSCGAASALQVIVQQGGANNISGSTYADKERTLINQTMLGAGTQSSVLVYEVVNLINNHTSASTYVYLNCTNISPGAFRNLIMSSLEKDCPVILHAMKEYIGYYPSSSGGGHYIVGFSLNTATDRFSVNDCNYIDAYSGVHITTLPAAYQSVHNIANRYLIYGT